MPSAGSVQSPFSIWVQILGAPVWVTHCALQWGWGWSDPPAAAGRIDGPLARSFCVGDGGTLASLWLQPLLPFKLCSGPSIPDPTQFALGHSRRCFKTGEEDAEVQGKTRVGQNAPGLSQELQG